MRYLDGNMHNFWVYGKLPAYLIGGKRTVMRDNAQSCSKRLLANTPHVKIH
jgi:hypothetical protein